METYTTVTMSPDDLLELITSAVRACFRDMPPSLEKGGSLGKRNKKMISARDIEEEYGITRRMLVEWRQAGIGPAYRNFGRKVFYDRAIFEKFIAAGQIQTTGFIDR